MRDGWTETTLNTVLLPVLTRARDNSEYEVLSVTEKRGIIPQTEIFNHRIATDDISKYKVLQPGDIAFNPYLLWCGAVGQWKGNYEGVVSPVYECFRVRETDSPRFVGLIFESGVLTPYFDSTAIGSIVRRRRTTLPVFYEAPILRPPLAEQKRIVDVVSSVDAYIDALQKQAQTARTARKAIEVAEFDNPENELSVLGDYCAKNDIQVGPFGSQLHQHEYVADGIPVVMPKNIVDGRISEKNIARITPEKASELKRHILMPGDVLFARRGDLSKRALVTEAQAGWLCGTGAVRVRSKKIDGAILFRLTNTSDVNTWLMDNSVGATMPNLNTAIVASIPLRVPGNASEAVSLLRGMDDYLDGLTNSIRSAMELRSGLLSNLLSGEYEIPATYDSVLGVA